VWVTNRQNRINASPNDGFNNRNIIALQDLGEAQLPNLPTNQVVVINPSTGFFNVPANTPSNNSNNKYDPKQIESGGGYLNNNIRDVATAGAGFNIPGGAANEGTDYIILENARNLNPND